MFTTVPRVEFSQNPSMTDEVPLLRLTTQNTLKQKYEGTCCATCSLYFAFGTFKGEVYIFELDTFKLLTYYKSGLYSIVDLSFDRSSQFLCSSNLDGSVSVRTSTDGGNNWDEKHSATFVTYSFGLKIALDPNCYRNGDFAFASGGYEGKVVLTRKNWFFSSKTNEIGSFVPGDQGIQKIIWRDNLISWTCEKGGLRIHDITLNGPVGKFRREEPFDSNVEDVLTWEDDETLLLGWGNRVGVIRVKKETDPFILRTASILLWLEFPTSIYYISPFGGRNGRLLIAGTDGNFRLVERKDGATVAQLKVINQEENRKMFKVSHDMYWNSLLPDDLPSKTRFSVQEETGLPYLYSISANEDDIENTCLLSVLRSRTIEDCLQDALNKSDFEKAMSIARGAHSENWCSLNESQVADLWIASLMSTNSYDEVQKVIPTVLKQSDIQSWARWTAVLAERRELYRIVDFIPPSKLPSALYEAALSEILERKNDDEHYVNLVRKFLGSINSERTANEIQVVVEANNERSKILKAALALTYSSLPNRFQDAFWAMLDSKSFDVFSVLEKNISGGNSLLAQVMEKNRLPDLCAIDEDHCLALLYPLLSFSSTTGNDGEQQTTNLVAQQFPQLIKQFCDKGMEAAALKLLRKWNRMENIPSSTDMCDLEVELCAKIDPQRLFELLRDSNGYSPNKALALCKRRAPEFFKETVFLLQRMGGAKHSSEALNILVNQMKDMDAALEYAERDDLFDELVRLCVSPNSLQNLTIELLSKAGNYSIDPARLVRALPSGLPEVRLRFVKLFRDVRANCASRRVANRLFMEDDSSVARSINRKFRQGIKVSWNLKQCNLCGNVLSALNKADLVVFRTGDTYHYDCLQRASKSLGPIANKVGIFEDVSAASLMKQHCVVFGSSQEKRRAGSLDNTYMTSMDF